jgi:hypothetical protein
MVKTPEGFVVKKSSNKGSWLKWFLIVVAVIVILLPILTGIKRIQKTG